MEKHFLYSSMFIPIQRIFFLVMGTIKIFY